ncbi:MAG: RuBisCO accumulation factor 1 [Xenococcaceae cyanobacterium]
MPQESTTKLSKEEAQELMRSLLHKEGSWVDWGKACQKLQKSGYNTSEIFEATGFQASQQNLVIVAAQVYSSITEANLPEEVLAYFRGPRSDVLHEFRILNQEQRAAAAQLAYDKKLDIDGAHQVARAVKDFSRLSQLPAGFTRHPGDAVAYLCWKNARQKKDLQERSRLIAQGLKFAHSQTARESIEKLLSDFTVTVAHTAPLLPIYRLESENELPYIIPLAGAFPLSRQTLETVTQVTREEPFGNIKVTSGGLFVPVPGWQAILKASDPVGIFWSSDRLPTSISGKVEQVLVIIDRAVQTWDVNSYFLVEAEDKLELQWFEEAPDLAIIGQLVLIMRPKRILDENNILEPWQMDD